MSSINGAGLSGKKQRRSNEEPFSFYQISFLSVKNNIILVVFLVMKVSFVIPTHNEEKYISQTIELILKQPKELIEEIIVVDYDSDDRTVQKKSEVYRAKTGLPLL